MTGYISSIERHRIDTDGKGVRTLVAFAGCPLKCKHCPNKITWDKNSSKEYTQYQLIKELRVDDVYFRATGGGVTFGGGEPLQQVRFIKDFIEKSPKHWRFNVETSLSVNFIKIRYIAKLIDTFYVDIKTLDSDIYYEYTGAKLKRALNNLLKLKKLVGEDKIVVRVPTIPVYVDEKSQQRTIKQLKDFGFNNIDAFDYFCE